MSGQSGRTGQPKPAIRPLVRPKRPLGERRIQRPAIEPVQTPTESETEPGTPHPFGGDVRGHTQKEDASRFIPPGEEEEPIPEGFWDPRENEPWFKNLSPRERDHFRRTWIKEQVAMENRAKWDRDRFLHSVIECVLVFGVCQGILVELGMLSLVLGVLVGATAGLCAHITRATRAPGILIGFAAMVVLQTIHLLLGGKPADIFSLVLFWLLVIGTFMSAGIRREGEQFGA